MLRHCTATVFPAVSPNYCDLNIMLTLSLFYSHFMCDFSVHYLWVWNHFVALLHGSWHICSFLPEKQYIFICKATQSGNVHLLTWLPKRHSLYTWKTTNVLWLDCFRFSLFTEWRVPHTLPSLEKCFVICLMIIRRPISWLLCDVMS